MDASTATNSPDLFPRTGHVGLSTGCRRDYDVIASSHTKNAPPVNIFAQ